MAKTKMIIDTKKPVINFEGEAMKKEDGTDSTIGYILSNMILTNKEDPLRAYLLAQEIYKCEGEYEVKDQDKSFIKDGINKSDFTVLVKGQMLALF